MRSVFESSTGLEAHMILNLLLQEGIVGRVEGEHLQGGVGELPAINVVRVVVEDEDYERARAIIQAWESTQSDSTQGERPARRPSRAGYGFLIGLLVGIGGMYLAYSTPVTSEGIDYNGDGTLDEVWTYKGNRISAAELDRNLDGRVDLIYEYDHRGVVQRSRSDDNFDGRFETVTAFRNGNPYSSESGLNQAGFVDYRVISPHGIAQVVEILDPETRTVRKRQHFTAGKLSSAEYDSTGDGILDTCYQYDFFEEKSEESSC